MPLGRGVVHFFTATQGSMWCSGDRGKEALPSRARLDVVQHPSATSCSMRLPRAGHV